MGKFLITSVRRIKIDVRDDVERQILIKLGRNGVHRRKRQFAAFAPTVIHPLKGINCELFASYLDRPRHPSGHVEVSFPGFGQA